MTDDPGLMTVLLAMFAGAIRVSTPFLFVSLGEMLTEMFVERIDGLSMSRELRTDAQAFGEGLQLVNILKDADDDARWGRLFLPDGFERSAVFNLARDDLRQAEMYVRRLREPERG